MADYESDDFDESDDEVAAGTGGRQDPAEPASPQQEQRGRPSAPGLPFPERPETVPPHSSPPGSWQRPESRQGEGEVEEQARRRWVVSDSDSPHGRKSPSPSPPEPPSPHKGSVDKLQQERTSLPQEPTSPTSPASRQEPASPTSPNSGRPRPPLRSSSSMGQAKPQLTGIPAVRARMKASAFGAGGRGWPNLFRQQCSSPGIVRWQDFLVLCREVLKITDDERELKTVYLSLVTDGSDELGIEDLIAFVSDPVERMRSQVRASAFSSHAGEWQAFRRDKELRGSVCLAWGEFHELCRQRLSLCDDDAQLDILWDALDEAGEGEISFPQLVQFIEQDGDQDQSPSAGQLPNRAESRLDGPLRNVAPTPPVAKGGRSSPLAASGRATPSTPASRSGAGTPGSRANGVEMSNALAKMRSRLKGAAYTVGGRDWSKLFHEQDKDRSGHLGWDEFRVMCRKVLKLTEEETQLKTVFRSLDADRSGSIAIEELVQFVSDPVNRMRARLRSAADSQGQGDWQGYLRRWNKSGSGRLNWPEFKVMCQKGLKLLDDDAQLGMAFKALDTDNSGEVSMEEVIDFIMADEDGERIRPTALRDQALLEEPDSGELRIDIEYHNHQDTFHHSFPLERYEHAAMTLKEELERELSDIGSPFEVRLNPGPPGTFRKYYDLHGWYVHARTADFRARSRWASQVPKLVQYPRLGSFEVSVRLPAPVKRSTGAYQGLPRQFEVWSKIRRRKWPKEGFGEWVARHLIAARDGDNEAAMALLANGKVEHKDPVEERLDLDDPARYRRAERNPPMFMSMMPRVALPPAVVPKKGSKKRELPNIAAARLPEGALDRLRSRLKGAAYNIGGRDWVKLFKEQDKDKSGNIGWEEFRQMCRRVLRLTEQEPVLRALFQSLDADGSGELEIDELVAYVADPIARMRSRLKNAAEANAEGKVGKSWIDLILDADKDGSGQIDWIEFRTMCRKTLKLLDSNEQLKGVFNALDEDGSGEISVDELISFVSEATSTPEPLRQDHRRGQGRNTASSSKTSSLPPPVKKSSPAVVSKVRGRLKGAAYTLSGKDWTRLFYEQDGDESGQMDWPHFRVFCRNVLKLSDDTNSLREFFDAVDINQCGEVSIQGLINFITEGPVSVEACMEVLGKAEWAAQQHWEH